MDATNDEPRLTEPTCAARSEEDARTPETTVVAVARMLANPRRIRRS